MSHHSKQEALDKDSRDGKITHTPKIIEQGNVVITMEVEFALHYSLKVEFFHIFMFFCGKYKDFLSHFTPFLPSFCPFLPYMENFVEK